MSKNKQNTQGGTTCLSCCKHWSKEGVSVQNGSFLRRLVIISLILLHSIQYVINFVKEYKQIPYLRILFFVYFTQWHILVFCFKSREKSPFPSFF